MRIEFEISDQDVAVLYPALQRAAALAQDPQTIATLTKLIREIEEDYNNSIWIHQHLKAYLGPYTNGADMKKEYELYMHLGVSMDFIRSTEGLVAVLNYILATMVSAGKPGKQPAYIRDMAKVVKLKTVQDCIDIIQASYENS